MWEHDFPNPPGIIRPTRKLWQELGERLKKSRAVLVPPGPGIKARPTLPSDAGAQAFRTQGCEIPPLSRGQSVMPRGRRPPFQQPATFRPRFYLWAINGYYSPRAFVSLSLPAPRRRAVISCSPHCIKRGREAASCSTRTAGHSQPFAGGPGKANFASLPWPGRSPYTHCAPDGCWRGPQADLPSLCPGETCV